MSAQHQSKHVLVIGGSGFAGGFLCRHLAERGDIVAAADRTAGGDTHVLDITDAARTEELVRELRPDAIIHLAALSSVGRSFDDPRPTFAVNGLGTLNVLEAVRRASPATRVLVVGSAVVYGPSAPDGAHDEQAPFNPISPYAASKVWQDVLTGQYALSYNLDTIRVRPFNHTGPGQGPTFVLASFAQQIAAIERGAQEPLLKVGNLDAVRDYLDVRDVVRCYARILDSAASGSVWNVCSGHGFVLRDLLEQLLALSTVSIRVAEDSSRLRPADVSRLVGDPRRARAELGWEPELTMDRTLVDLLQEARTQSA